MTGILLNCDFDERVDSATTSALLAVVDLANIAPVDPSGNQSTVRRVVAEALQHGVRIGAHPGILHHEGKTVSPLELTELLSKQITDFVRVHDEAGGRVGHVKFRGALDRWCDERTDLAEACVDWMEAELEGIPLIVGAGGLLHAVAEARGVPLLREISACRVYADEARLVSHAEEGAVIADPEDAIARIREWRQTGYLALADGRRWLVEAETICVGADAPASLPVALALREILGTGKAAGS